MKFNSNFLTAVLLVTAASVLVCGVWRDYHCCSLADKAAQNLQQCRQIAEQIQKLQSAPVQASVDGKTMNTLSTTISKAAEVAEIPESAIKRKDPQALRRIGKTSYLEQPTQVKLDKVTLEALVAFLCEIAYSEDNLKTTSLRLSAPRSKPKKDEPETWSAEVILTHLIFSVESP